MSVKEIPPRFSGNLVPDPSVPALPVFSSASPMPSLSAPQPTHLEYGNGKVYAWGGNDGNGNGVLRSYDVLTKVWSTLTPLSGRVAPGYGPPVFTGGYLYVPGSASGGGNGSADWDRYDPVSDSWTSLTPRPVNAAYGGTVAVGGNIYIFGCRNPYDAASRYNVASDTWTTLTSMPTATGQTVRHYATADSSGTYIYIVSSLGPTLQRYSISGNSYTTLATPPVSDSRINWFDSVLWAFSNGSTSVYDISQNKWVPYGGVSEVNGAKVCQNEKHVYAALTTSGSFTSFDLIEKPSASYRLLVESSVVGNYVISVGKAVFIKDMWLP